MRNPGVMHASYYYNATFWVPLKDKSHTYINLLCEVIQNEKVRKWDTWMEKMLINAVL